VDTGCIEGGMQVQCPFTQSTEISDMEWTTPDFQEVCLSCEINTYASAEY